MPNPRKKIVFDFAGVLFHWHPETMLQREVPHLAPDEASLAQRNEELLRFDAKENLT